MTSEEFRIKHNEILDKYQIEFENNCDYWARVTGNIYTQGDHFITHITGISYTDDGDWQGDLDGYIKLLEYAVKEWSLKQLESKPL